MSLSENRYPLFRDMRVLERAARIELASSRRHRAALPLSYVRRFGASPRIRTSRQPTCLFHRRRFYGPVAGEGREYVCAAMFRGSGNKIGVTIDRNAAVPSRHALV